MKAIVIHTYGNEDVLQQFLIEQDTVKDETGMEDK